MSKYKIEIEIDVDFDKIFSQIPEGLFSGDNKVCDESYERECISELLAGTHRHSILKNTDELAKDPKSGLYKYLKHNIECDLAVSKQIAKNHKITKVPDEPLERILCAAIQYEEFERPAHGPKNVHEGVVLCGWRHSSVIGQCSSIMTKRQAEMGEYEQGFLTSKNRFVGREEALKIALNAGQVLDESKVRGGKLYSEDLY